MSPTLDSRIKNPDVGIPVLQTQSEVKVQLISYIMLCVSPMIKSNILQLYTRLYIQIVEANILFGQRM
jgi:hypothetical protein